MDAGRFVCVCFFGSYLGGHFRWCRSCSRKQEHVMKTMTQIRVLQKLNEKYFDLRRLQSECPLAERRNVEKNAKKVRELIDKVENDANLAVEVEKALA